MSDEVVVFYVCDKGDGHIDVEGFCGSHWGAEIVVRGIPDGYRETVNLEKIAEEVRDAIEGYYRD